MTNYNERLDETLTERGNKYGKTFMGNARISQPLKGLFRSSPNWQHLDADQKEALDNIAIKLSRILNEDADVTYADNWTDIAGYATLVANRLEE